MIMENTLRAKVEAGEPTLGTHYLSSDPDTAEIIGDVGLFDYAEFCAEYSTFDMSLLYHMARAAQCADLPLMIKLDQINQGFWAQAAIGAGCELDPERIGIALAHIRRGTGKRGIAQLPRRVGKNHRRLDHAHRRVWIFA